MVKCSNCHCEIEESKMILHERFCLQNIKYCDICKEGVIKEEYEEHCLNHNKDGNQSGKKELDSEEERNSRSLERTMSSKVACDYCGLFLGFTELEEHEEMCGARSTKCKICGYNSLFKNIKNHFINVHKIDESVYKEYDSGINNSNSNNVDLNKNVNKPNINYSKGELTEEELKRMTSEEQIQYVLALSQKDKNNNNLNNNKNNKLDIPNKSSSGINYDEIDNEYERQMYEEEMRNFNNNQWNMYKK